MMDWIEALRVFFPLLVCLCTALMAVLLIVADPHRGWNQILALFLGLVSLNFLSETITGSYHVLGVQIAPGTFIGSPEAWSRIGLVALVLDPAVIAYFSLIFPRRHRLSTQTALVLGGIVGVFLLLELGGGHLSSRHPLVWPLLIAYLAGAYAFAALRLVHGHLNERSGVMADRVRLVALGFLVALLPRIAIVPFEFLDNVAAFFDPLDMGRFVAAFILYSVILWGFFAALWTWARRIRHRTGARRAQDLQKGLLSVAAVFLVFTLAIGFPVLLTHNASWFPGNLRTLFLWTVPGAVRWMIFSGLIFYGIVRYGLFMINAKTLRATALGTGMVTTGLLGGTTAALLDPWIVGVLAGSAIIIGWAVVRSWPRREPPRPMSGYLRQRALQTYRFALAAAVADDVVDRNEQERLARMRKRLGLSRREHEVLLGIAQAEDKQQSQRPLLLGKYESLHLLGSGGYASVHLARDPDDDGLVAVKLYEGSLLDKGALDAAERELKVAQRVSHPNLLAIHEVTPTSSGIAVVLEYAPGGSLRDLIDEKGALPAQEVHRLLDQILAGLQALHEAGLTHGDIKPANIVLDARGDVKLSDFGSTGRSAATGTVGKSLPGPGTLRYLAPEVVAGATPAPKSDIYSAAITGLEMMVGRYPSGEREALENWTGPPPVEGLEAAEQQAVRRFYSLPTEKTPTPTVSQAAFFAKALARDPRERYATAAEMRKHLQGVFEPPEPVSRPGGRTLLTPFRKPGQA